MEQKTRGRYIVGLLLLVILTSSVYLVFQDEGVKIDIQRTRTFYYVDVDGSWQLAGIEYVNLFDGTAKMRASSRSLETFVDGDLIKIIRTANYKQNISTIETYLFDGSLKAVETFPLQHEIRVLNGEGKILQYEITDLNYSGPTVWNVESPQEFGWNMKAEWDLGYYYSRIWGYANRDEGKLTIRYRPNSTDYIINARFFDPEPLITVQLLEPENNETLQINPVSFKANYTSQEGFKTAYLWTNHTGTWTNHTILTGNNSDYAKNTTYDAFDSGVVYPRGWEIVVGEEDVLLTNVTWLAGSGYNATISQNNFDNVLQTSLITDNLSTHYLTLEAGGVYQITTDSPNFYRLYDLETRNSTNGWFSYKHYNLGPFFRHNIDTINVQKDGEIEGEFTFTDGTVKWNVEVCPFESNCTFSLENSTFTMDDLGAIVYINSPLNQTYSILPILLNITTEGQVVSSILYNLNDGTNLTYITPINITSFDSQGNTLNVYANYSSTEISFNSTIFTLAPLFVNLVSPANSTLTTSVNNLFDFKVFNIAENYISNISIFMFINNQWSVQNTTSFSYDTPISSIEDLLLMNGSSDSFVLSKDLDFCDENSYDDPLNGQANITTLCKDNLPQPGWVPLDTFTGQLEGNMHTIKNLYINNSPFINDQGLFKTISNSTIQNLIFEDPIVVGVNNYGGSIAGSAADRSYVRNVIIINPYFSGSYYLGGLVGRFRDSQMHECQVQGGYIFANSQYVGGLVGQINDQNYQGSSLMTNSFSSANIENENFGGIGGVAGLAYDTTINNSYATGDVIDGNSQCGGLVGWAFRNLTVQNSYAIGNVTCVSSTRKGGLIGFIGPNEGGGDPDTVAIDSFYDTNTTGQNDTGYGTPKTTIEMQNISTFTNWDIATIGSFVDQTWYINETNDYPRLYFEQRDLKDLYFSIYSDVPQDASTLWKAQTCLSTGVCFDSEEEWVIEHANNMRLLAEGTSLTNETFSVELGSIIEITYDRRDSEGNFLLAFLDVFYPLLGLNVSNGTGTTLYNLTIDRFFKYIDYDPILLDEIFTDTSFNTVASFDNSGKTMTGTFDRFWYAQRFTTPSEGNLTVNQVILSLEPSDATPEPFSFNVSIRNGTATSADLSNGSINMSILAEAYIVGGLFTIDIEPITLNASTNYTIVMNCEDCYVSPTQQIVNIHSSGSSGSLYGGFIFSEDSGVSWDPPVETTEFIFYVGYNESFTSQVYESNILNVTMHQHDEVINVTLDFQSEGGPLDLESSLGPVIYYNFNETTVFNGAPVYDISGNSYDGYVGGNLIGGAQGIIDYCYEHIGTSAIVVNESKPPIIIYDRDWTLTMWAKSDITQMELPYADNIFSKHQSLDFRLVNSSTDLQLSIFIFSYDLFAYNEWFPFSESEVASIINEFTFYTIKWDSNSKYMHACYSNGTLQCYSYNVGFLNFTRDMGSLIGLGWEGLIDEFIVYDRMLTEEEIQFIYESQSAGELRTYENPKDVLIYKVNSTKLDKAYIGEITGEGNVFNTQFTDITTEDYVDEVELVYSSDSKRRVYFLIDRYSSILGLSFDLSFITQGFQFYDSFDTEDSRDPILSDATIQGRTVMPQPSSILDFTYDDFSGSFNSTKWLKYPDTSGSETDFYSWSTTTTQTGGELRNKIDVAAIGSWDARQGTSRNIQVNQINKDLLNIPTAESIEIEFNFNNFKETYYALSGQGSIERCFAELRLFAGGQEIWRDYYSPRIRCFTRDDLNNQWCTSTGQTQGNMKVKITKDGVKGYEIKYSGIEKYYSDEKEIGGCGQQEWIVDWDAQTVTYTSQNCPSSITSINNTKYITATKFVDGEIYFESKGDASKNRFGQYGCSRLISNLNIVNVDYTKGSYSNQSFYSRLLHESQVDITSLVPTVRGYVPSGTGIDLYFSADGKTTWQQFVSGVTTVVDNPGKLLYFRADFDVGEGGYMNVAPHIDSIEFTLEDSSPSNITIDLGANGTINYYLNGTLNETNGTISIVFDRPISLVPSEWDSVLNNSLISWWAFEETSGTNSEDLHGSNNGTASDERIFTSEITGIVGTGADFSQGTTDNITIPHSTDFNFGTGNFSFSVWINSSGTTDEFYLSKAESVSPWTGYALRDSSNKWRITFTDSLGTSFVESTTNRNTSKYVHFVFTRNGNNHSIYIDGVLDATKDTTARDVDNIVDLILGAKIDGWGGTSSAGYMDELAYWSRVLTADDVTLLYNLGDGLTYGEYYEFGYIDPSYNFSQNSAFLGDSYNIPIEIGSESAGIITVNGLELLYYPSPIVLDASYFQSYLDTYGNLTTNVPLVIQSSGNQSYLNISDFNVTYAGGSQTYELNVRDEGNTTLIRGFLTYIYSRWDYRWGNSDVNYIFFNPLLPTQTNVRPYGQTLTSPILTIDNLGYNGPSDLYVKVDSTLDCVNMTIWRDGSKAQITDEWLHLDELAYLDEYDVFLYADYSCNYQNWKLFDPIIYFRQCAVDSYCGEDID